MDRYQLLKAGLLITGYDSKSWNPPLEESLEVLRLEHFYLPLIILFGGLILSTVTFIAEIIINRIQRND